MADRPDQPPRGGTTVVVVDDHPMVAEVVMKIVGRLEGFSAVAWASTAAEGIAAVMTHHPDVVILDYALPDEDGAELARRIRQLRPATRLVMFTGASAPGALVKALDAGCHGFVKKGEPRAELVRVLRAVVAGGVEFPSDVLAELPRLEDLVVHYQPIVDLESEAAVGAEALVRWNHPVRGLVGPGEFITRAEETGLIVALGTEVLRRACQQASAWRQELPNGRSLSVSVNASAQQLDRYDFVDGVAEALAAAQLPADSLVIELTETGIMDRQERAAEQLRAVRALGVELRVDDFGTGYSSLTNLRRFPIGALKLDRSFVHGMLEQPEDEQIVAASIRLAHSLGLRSVAEGVELEAQADRLRDLGCELAQGYLWSRPLPPAAFASWYASRTPSSPAVSAAPRLPSDENKRVDDEIAISRRRHEHCGWCHRKGAYLLSDRPILRCKYCQASMSFPPSSREAVEQDLKANAKLLQGLSATKRSGKGACLECGTPALS